MSAVHGGQIADRTVLYRKIQDVSANRLLGSVAGGTVEEIACTAAGRALIDDADAAAQRVTLGLEIGVNVPSYSDTRFLRRIDPWSNIFYSLLPSGGRSIMVSGTAYFVYLGRVVQDCVVKHVELQVAALPGAGSQACEVGLFSTPLPPCKAGQSMTKLVSTATVDALTSNGVKRNTTAFATTIPEGTELWGGLRAVMGTTQATVMQLGGDMEQGAILALAASGALTGAGPFAGSLITAGSGSECPVLRATLV